MNFIPHGNHDYCFEVNSLAESSVNKSNSRVMRQEVEVVLGALKHLVANDCGRYDIDNPANTVMGIADLLKHRLPLLFGQSLRIYMEETRKKC